MTKKKLSKEYLNNLENYKKMHLEGYKLIDGRKRNPNNAYDGKSTLIYAKLIKEIIRKNNIKSMLDLTPFRFDITSIDSSDLSLL